MFTSLVRTTLFQTGPLALELLKKATRTVSDAVRISLNAGGAFPGPKPHMKPARIRRCLTTGLRKTWEFPP